MKRPTTLRKPKPWCSTHRDRTVKVETDCAYCHRPMHIHESNVRLAKRCVAQPLICPRCRGNNRLVMGSGSIYWQMMVVDQGQPAIQLNLPRVAGLGGPRHA